MKATKPADLKKGQLYQWNGVEFVEIEPSDTAKLPVTEDALEAVKAIRKEAAARIGMRPDLGIVASAMLLAASKVSDMPQQVKEYGAQIYGS
jgi:hypothetical protein